MPIAPEPAICAARRSEDATMTASLDFDSRFLHSMISVADVPSIPDESEG
jgi:hypothetical protein